MNHPTAPPYNLGPPPHKRRHRARNALIVAGVLFVVLCTGTTATIIDHATSPAAAPAATSEQPASTTSAPAAPKSTAPTSKAAPAAPQPATIDDGEWQAGTDFPLGTYDVTSHEQLCVWQVYHGDAGHPTYDDPGHVGPGHYTYNAKAGQTLSTNGCGTWRRVK
jgi:hypothetical protein